MWFSFLRNNIKGLLGAKNNNFQIYTFWYLSPRQKMNYKHFNVLA